MTSRNKGTLKPTDAGEMLARTLWFVRQEDFAVPGAELEARTRWRSSPTEERFLSARIELLRGAVALAGYAGDPALLPLLLEALEEYDELSGYRDEHDQFEVFASAIQWLLQLGAPVTAEVRALAQHKDGDIRLALVQGLQDAATEFEPLLRSLAADDDAQVRKAVKDALSALGELPWWTGLFARDPALVVSAEDAPRVSPLLARWAELMNSPYGPHGAEREELYTLLDGLPDVLARDAVVRLLTAEGGYYDHARLSQRLIRIPESGSTAIELATLGGGYRMRQFLELYAQSEGSKSEAAARRAFEAVLARPEAELGEISSVAWVLGELGRWLWPPEADPSDIVARVLETYEPLDPYEMDVMVSVADQLGAQSPICTDRWREQAVEAFLEGEKQSAWSHMRRLREAVLRTLPLEERRVVARRALPSQVDEVAGWGLSQIVGEAHDPERDPPVPELVASLCTDLRLRALVTRRADLVQAHSALLLRYLHAGELTLSAACALLDHLAAPGEQMKDALVGDAWEGEERSSLIKLPKEPPRIKDTDWAAWRRLRDAETGVSDYWRLALFSMPRGPLCPEDRAYVLRALERVRAGDDDSLLGIAIALMVGGLPEDLPIMDELIRKDDDDMTHDLRERMQQRLGLIPPRVRGKPAKKTKSEEPKEWMDEDD